MFVLSNLFSYCIDITYMCHVAYPPQKTTFFSSTYPGRQMPEARPLMKTENKCLVTDSVENCDCVQIATGEIHCLCDQLWLYLMRVLLKKDTRTSDPRPERSSALHPLLSLPTTALERQTCFQN